jgi:hypothetical protein
VFLGLTITAGTAAQRWTEVMSMADDYIRKQDAVDLVNKISNLDLKAKGGICVSLANLEKADVVPVVRCKDCKFRENDDFCTGRGFPYQLVPDDGFCDKGKRKE